MSIRDEFEEWRASAPPEYWTTATDKEKTQEAWQAATERALQELQKLSSELRGETVNSNRLISEAMRRIKGE